MWDSGKKLTLSDSNKRIFLQILKAQPFGNEELVSKQCPRVFVARIYRKEVLKVKQFNSSLWFNYGVLWAILQMSGFSISQFTLQYFVQFKDGGRYNDVHEAVLLWCFLKTKHLMTATLKSFVHKLPSRLVDFTMSYIVGSIYDSFRENVTSEMLPWQ